MWNSSAAVARPFAPPVTLINSAINQRRKG
jgi:hypothetical protein